MLDIVVRTAILQCTMYQSRVASFVCPSEVGRIPTKMSSGFTAEQ